MGVVDEARARAQDNPPAIFVDELSSVAQSLVLAFSHGIAWNKAFYKAYANHRSIEPFLQNSGAWRCGDRESASSHAELREQSKVEEDFEVSAKTEISGEELYLILSHQIYEREGVEHENKSVNGKSIKTFIDGYSEISFDRRGIKAGGLRVTQPDNDGVVLNAFGLNQPIPITLENCDFEGRVILDWAKLGHLSLKKAKFLSPENTIKTNPDISAESSQFDGDLNLEELQCAGIKISRAKIANGLTLENSTITQYFEPEIESDVAVAADAVVIGGSVFLRSRFLAKGPVVLIKSIIGGNLDCTSAKIDGGFLLQGAKIGGRFDCEAAQLTNPGDVALVCDGAAIDGGVILRGGFYSEGEVRFVGAKVSGPLDCARGKFINQKGRALNCDSISIGGSVFLRSGFSVIGGVDFTRATIGGSFHLTHCLLGQCKEGRIDNKNDTIGRKKDVAFGAWRLTLRSARVGANLFISRVDCSQKALGEIDLRDSRAAVLADDDSYWRSGRVTLRLDGFEYSRLSDDNFADYSDLKVPIDWKTRRDWLLRQPSADQGENFRPQPWIQCAKVLKEMGHEGNALRLDESREWVRLVSSVSPRYKRLYIVLFSPIAAVSDLIDESLRYVAWLPRFLFGTLTGFGRAYWRAFLCSLIIIWFGALFYENGFTNGVILRDPEASFAKRRPITASMEPVEKSSEKHYPAFDAWLYSLDTFLPIVDLRQAKYWLPGDRSWTPTNSPPNTELDVDGPIIINSATNSVMQQQRIRDLSPNAFYLWAWTWFEIIMGWVFSTVIIAGFTGILDRRK